MTQDNDQNPERVITLKEMGERIMRRRAELEAQGITIDIPRNAGTNRVFGKRALLRVIEELGGKW